MHYLPGCVNKGDKPPPQSCPDDPEHRFVGGSRPKLEPGRCVPFKTYDFHAAGFIGVYWGSGTWQFSKVQFYHNKWCDDTPNNLGPLLERKGKEEGGCADGRNGKFHTRVNAVKAIK